MQNAIIHDSLHSTTHAQPSTHKPRREKLRIQNCKAIIAFYTSISFYRRVGKYFASFSRQCHPTAMGKLYSLPLVILPLTHVKKSWNFTCITNQVCASPYFLAISSTHPLKQFWDRIYPTYSFSSTVPKHSLLSNPAQHWVDCQALSPILLSHLFSH